MIVTPGSDGAGIVVEVGALVTRFGKGERVLPAFWLSRLAACGAVSLRMEG
jgi:NADPH:quinone reductase-like Zn-dependent oxidoreductase